MYRCLCRDLISKLRAPKFSRKWKSVKQQWKDGRWLKRPHQFERGGRVFSLPDLTHSELSDWQPPWPAPVLSWGYVRAGTAALVIPQLRGGSGPRNLSLSLSRESEGKQRRTYEAKAAASARAKLQRELPFVHMRSWLWPWGLCCAGTCMMIIDF